MKTTTAINAVVTKKINKNPAISRLRPDMRLAIATEHDADFKGDNALDYYKRKVEGLRF